MREPVMRRPSAVVDARRALVVAMIEPAINCPCAVVLERDVDEVEVRVPMVAEPILPCPIVAFVVLRV